MDTEFICTVDGRQFLSEKEALSYMVKEYIEEVETNDGLEEIQLRLEKELPGFIFKVSKRPHTHEHESYGEEDDPWFKGKYIIYVNISSEQFEMPHIFFEVKEKYPESYRDSQEEFQTLDEAIVFYKRFLFGAETFTKSVLQEVSQYNPTIVDCKLKKIVQTYGTSDSFNEYHACYVHKDGKEIGDFYIELDTYDLESDPRLQSEIEKYVTRIKGRYISSIEGEVTIKSPKYCNDHSYWFEIDGVPAFSLADRAKKIRVEILEEKI